mmetsp:Transcript_132309/g.230120  ORF Transcript_132309/g.230120 Transcript_132309/m.230120 type:complete len:114 (-) Transcript_132309:649-990(-)
MADSQKLWKVVGGTDTGGILVRHGKDFESEKALRRLATKSIIEELELMDGRLHYILVSGSGPATGWVSLKLKSKELLAPVEPSIVSDSSELAPSDTISRNLSTDRQIATFAMG